jgi:predicted acylesterase/phospholipase RssA
MPRHEQVKTVIATIVLLLFFVVLSVAQPPEQHNRDSLSTKTHLAPIALALSGGGARGLAGVGVLKAFEERGIEIRAIAGTSIGGIVGGLFACGYSADQIKTIVRKIDFKRLFTNDPPRTSMLFTQRRERERHIISVRFDGLAPQFPHALTGGQELTTFLTELTLAATYRAEGRFSNLRIPFKTVCTDIVSGREIVLDTGSLSDAMRATMAFPLAFTGVEQGDKLLMDGGMLTPIPVALARSMDSDSLLVVAVNTTSPLLPKSGLVSLVEIANQVTTIMSGHSLAVQLALADYVISPELDGISATNFELRDSIMALGYRAALTIADSILERTAHSNKHLLNGAHADSITDHLGDSRLVVHGITAFSADSVIRWLSPDRYPVHGATLRQRLDSLLERYRTDGYDLALVSDITVDSLGTTTVTLNEGIVRRIDVRKNGKTRDWVVRSYFPLHRGEPFSLSRALRGLRGVFGTDLFDRVTLHVIPEDSGSRVIIGVKERKSVQARLGWHWDDHYQSEEFLEVLNDNVFGMGLEYLAHVRYGLDRRAFFGELRANRIFSTYLTGQIRVGYTAVDRTTYDTLGNPRGVREESRFGLMLNVGQQIARLGTITGGLTIQRVRHNDKAVPVEEFTLNTLNLESHVESFDRVPFPRSGKRHHLQIKYAPKFLANDKSFTRFYSSLEAYYTVAHKYTYHPKLSLGLSADGLPLSEQFYLGGAGSLNGYRGEAISGNKSILLNQELRVSLPLRFYATARWDIGDVSIALDQLKLENLRQGFGGALSLDMPIGPFELGYGRTVHGGERWYFSAGLEF